MEPLLSGDGFSTIHVLGAAQGLFLAVILVSKRHNSLPNKLLALVMFAFSLELITVVYHGRGYDEVWPGWIGATFPLPLLYVPVFYLYARTLSEAHPVLKRTDLLHALPFVLVALYLIPFYGQSGADKLALLRNPEVHPWTPPMTILNHFKFFYSFVYLVLTLHVLRRHRRRITEAFSSLEHINLAWLRNMVIGGAVLWGVGFVFFLVGLTGPGGEADPIEGYDDYIALGIAAYVYAIGYLGLRQPEIFAPRRAGPVATERVLMPEAAARNGTPPVESVAERTNSTEKPRYARSGMEPEAAQQYVQALLALMEREKLFTNSELTLQELADALALSPHNLSEVINTQLGKNFYDFVNGYRVEEVQRRLQDPHNAHLTVLALGLEAGFKSKSSFNAVFKKHVRMTPSQYRKQAAG